MVTGFSATAQDAMTIRRAAPVDIPALVALLEQYYTEWEVWEHDSPERVRHYVEQPLPFGYGIAESAGSLIGCVMLRPVPSIASAAECKRLFIAAQARGRGVASQLMDYVEAVAAGHHLEWIYLDSVDQFTGAISLYKKRGYDLCERFNDNSQSTLFFRKRLSA